MKEIVEETLATYFTTFVPDGVLKPDEDFFKLSRNAAIHELQNDLKEQEELELDLAEETTETINYLKSINDAEYEELKNDYR
ncbi:hypothetical protein RG608_04095 [Streptococcus sp. IsoGale022]|uniref:hypothetical protein n=1 Tax=Streptococcus sp. IsoGale022 TaxID=2923524 RepID=UPI00280FC94B|nr:hypothetical protein [Streptococcus sp. IsoGale022]MDQ8692337.1 hypothetical protein [Streptococcus sp. IsoGale022]